LIYYVAENESMFCLTQYLKERLGGEEVLISQLAKCTGKGGIYICPSFVSFKARRDRTRIFIGHGTSDKPIYKPNEATALTMFDYFFVSGDKDAWLFNRYGHMPHWPVERIIKTGLIRSDLILNKVYDREKILRKYSLPMNKKIVLFAPTFNAQSLPVYGDKFTNDIPKKYVFVVKVHDREMSRVVQLKHNVFNFRGPRADIIELMSVADYYIGDGSSCDYEFLFTLRPMIILLPGKPVVHDIPYEYDIRNVCFFHAPDMDIMKSLEEAEKPEYVELKKAFIDKCFYYNDGHAIDRACKAIEEFKRRIEFWEKWE